MAKYFMTWEVNQSLMPTDPKELAATVIKMGEMVKQGMKEGRTTDWGIFVDGAKGYSVGEASALDLYKNLQMYAPYIKFNVQEVLSIDDVLETFKSMMG